MEICEDDLDTSSLGVGNELWKLKPTANTDNFAAGFVKLDPPPGKHY